MADEPAWDDAEIESEGQILTEDEVAVKRPNMFKVILINDDYTPMEFVTWLLQSVFHKSPEDSVRLMLAVHHRGSAVCGLYPYDVARTKVYYVKGLAKKHEHPLECVIEEAGGDE